MAKKTKPVPTGSVTTRKLFNYQDEEVTLSFDLDCDNSRKLRKFKGLLEMAVKDIGDILATMKN